MPSRTAAPSSSAVPSAPAGTRAFTRTQRRSQRLVRMRSPERPPASSATRAASASATVFTMLAPIAFRQSTWTWTTTRRGCARTSISRAPPPRSTSRGSVACARSMQLPGRRLEARHRGLRIGDVDDLDLRGHHRIVRLGDEAAPLAHHPGRVRGGGDHRRLFDRHRHQHVAPVDAEVEPQPQRQRIDADHVLDDPVRGRGVEPAAVERLQVLLRQIGPVAQQLAPLLDRELVEAREAGAVVGAVSRHEAFLVVPRLAG